MSNLLSERLIQIPVDENLVADARFREVSGAPVVVIMHGMTCYMDAGLHVNFSRFLGENDYSSLRFNSYGYGPETRNLFDIGLSEHINDLTKAIEFAHQYSDNVAVVGHSFGGMCALLRGSHGVKGVAMWDPAPQDTWAEVLKGVCEYDERRKEYMYRDNTGNSYSQRIFDEVDAVDMNSVGESFRAPLLVVSATQFERLTKAGETYAKLIDGSEWVVIEGAEHYFLGEEHEKMLFSTSLNWLQKIMPK